MKRLKITCLLLILAAGCGRLSEVGRTPDFTPVATGLEYQAMAASAPTASGRSPAPSLWSAGPGSLLGDRRARETGDILTVVIEIDESAEISNTTTRGRSGSENLEMPELLGLGRIAGAVLPGDVDPANAVSTRSSSASSGRGAVRRNEELTLRVAATVLDVLPNGILRIHGSQEVRVNYEIRALLVDGFVRPGDITRRNEITYDKIASARIAYGGRGQISDVQQPRYGQQIADIVLPF